MAQAAVDSARGARPPRQSDLRRRARTPGGRLHPLEKGPRAAPPSPLPYDTTTCSAPAGRQRYPALDEPVQAVAPDPFFSASASREEEQLMKSQSSDRLIQWRAESAGLFLPGMEESDEPSLEGQERPALEERSVWRQSVSPEEVLCTMTAAQARRRFAPSWAFVAWEMDREWFSACMDYYFSVGRWPEPSKLPIWLKVACRDGGMSLHELYVQEPFAPMYMFILKRLDEEWFNWAIDYFFQSGHWPDFDLFPDYLHSACAEEGIGPDTYYSYE